jgi:hypothetical protein
MPLGLSNRLSEDPIALPPSIMQTSAAAASLLTTNSVQKLEPTIGERLLHNSHPSLMGGGAQGYNPFLPVRRAGLMQTEPLANTLMLLQANEHHHHQILLAKLRIEQDSISLKNARGQAPHCSYNSPSLMGGTQAYNPFAPVTRPVALQPGPFEIAFMTMQAQEQQQFISAKIRLTQQAMPLRNSRGQPPPSSYYTAATRKRPDPPKKEYSLTGRQPILMHRANEDESLSDYQCLVRNQIEVFEATKKDVKTGAQGRNRSIVLGQIGLRCRHCAALPRRKRGAVYYPARLHRVYQAAQNMAKSHFTDQCEQIGGDTRKELFTLCETRSSAGGGKKFWAYSISALGVYEDDDGLRFTRSLPDQK